MSPHRGVRIVSVIVFSFEGDGDTSIWNSNTVFVEPLRVRSAISICLGGDTVPVTPGDVFASGHDVATKSGNPVFGLTPEFVFE